MKRTIFAVLTLAFILSLTLPGALSVAAGPDSTVDTRGRSCVSMSAIYAIDGAAQRLRYGYPAGRMLNKSIRLTRNNRSVNNVLRAAQWQYRRGNRWIAYRITIYAGRRAWRYRCK